MVGIQDMGAAGLSCSTSEMGARAGTGIEIDIQKVPMRESGMTAYEVMLSESQERMLLVAQKGREDEVMRVFEKWDLHAEAIGTVTADKRLRVFNGGKLEADVPNEALTDEAPLYDRPWVVPTNPAAAEDVLALEPPADLGRRGFGFSPRPPSRASAGSIASTTARCARTPSWGPAPTLRSCASRARRRPWP